MYAPFIVTLIGSLMILTDMFVYDFNYANYFGNALVIGSALWNSKLNKFSFGRRKWWSMYIKSILAHFYYATQIFPQFPFKCEWLIQILSRLHWFASRSTVALQGLTGGWSASWTHNTLFRLAGNWLSDSPLGIDFEWFPASIWSALHCRLPEECPGTLPISWVDEGLRIWLSIHSHPS